MRIIAGRFARRKLLSPKGHLTRPTMSQTRESLFHLVTSRMSLEDADVLDLFAGTGAIGLEAISRSAAAVTFVEMEGQVLKFARRNAEQFGVLDHCMFLRADAVAYLQRYTGPPFDLIVADPPYRLEAMQRMPDLALPHVSEGGLFILEHDKNISFDDHPHLDTSRPYGRTYVSVFRAERLDAPDEEDETNEPAGLQEPAEPDEPRADAEDTR